ncbi:hypothetical protein [Roseiterribacter gracilis]|uniref:Uncharacterized protein n=1 Tax=Roseiterribacter gracilis TaxID=2812848 RepID=A0A8S8XCD2_9PROT|nr:hypothetical protein TMPK1_12040 [Rhodospirillales bacterium TMPK1]
MHEAELATRRRLAWLEAGLLDPGEFGHEEHVRLAFELLRRHDFIDALHRFAGGLKRMTARLGVGHKFNVTITVALASLIAERMQETPEATWDEFRDANPDLFDRKLLARSYAPERLSDERARKVFLLP